jgi:hypothetical protein
MTVRLPSWKSDISLFQSMKRLSSSFSSPIPVCTHLYAKTISSFYLLAFLHFFPLLKFFFQTTPFVFDVLFNIFSSFLITSIRFCSCLLLAYMTSFFICSTLFQLAGFGRATRSCAARTRLFKLINTQNWALCAASILFSSSRVIASRQIESTRQAKSYPNSASSHFCLFPFSCRFFLFKSAFFPLSFPTVTFLSPYIYAFLAFCLFPCGCLIQLVWHFLNSNDKLYFCQWVWSFLSPNVPSALFKGISKRWMRSSRVVRASDSQCRSRNWIDPSILWHSGIWGEADEAVMNKVREKF